MNTSRIRTVLRILAGKTPCPGRMKICFNPEEDSNGRPRPPQFATNQECRS